MTNQTAFEQIQQDISENAIVLYMKGTKEMPQCGFSSTVAQILRDRLGVPFKDVDVLSDLKIREDIKKFSNWPTIPQLYIKGEFIGGCDIVREMFQNGELQALLADKGIPFLTQ
jgi:monothiol glutaredoxin